MIFPDMRTTYANRSEPASFFQLISEISLGANVADSAGDKMECGKAEVTKTVFY